jgi:large repetitive protein
VDDVEFVFGSGAGVRSVAVNHALPGSGYDVDPASLNPAGTLSPGGVAWNGQFAAGSADPLALQLTGLVTDMAPGEVRQISQGTIVTAVLVAPNNSLLPVTMQLPAIVVSANHIINLTPSAQAADRNASVSYSVSLHNPLPTPQTYTLGVEGLERLTTDLPPSVVVAAGQTVDVPFRVTVPAGATFGLRVFDIVAHTAQGGRDSVEGRLTVRDDLIVPMSAVTLSLTPAQASAGQGTPAVYNVLVTNVGDATATFDLSGVFPPGITTTFSLTSLTIPPGVGNGRNVRLTLTPPPGTAAGDTGFSVTVVSTSDPSVAATVNGTVTVLATGVDIALTPSSTAPGSSLQLTVTNRGQATDTFDLSLAGPAALVAHLATNRVTLGPGASQVVTITTGGVGFAVPGALSLIGMAQSVANAAVRDIAAADLTVAAARGVETRFDPAAQTRTTPGSRSFLLQIDNVGNTEDGYEVTILSATGGVVASLAGLDGLPTQTIPVVRLPGLASGAILLNADMPAVGQGTVTVRVRSSDGSVVRTATATLAVVPPAAPAPTPAPPSVPVPAPDLVPPGPPGVLIPVTVKFHSTRSLFRNEAGVFVLDADGKIDGVAPGQPGFLARALSRRRVLVRRNQRPGATNRLKLQGGQRLLFYLVQNGTLEAVVGANPDNLLAGRPILFLSSADVNPDRLPHLRIVRAGKNVKLLWEDLSRGDQDFNDVVLSLRLG